MPTNITTYSNQKLEPFMNPEEAKMMDIKLVASIDYAAGTILGEVTATPGTYKAYTTGATDGSQFPRLILAYAVSTDASQNVTFTTTAGQAGGDLGQTLKYAPAYYKGTFWCADLTGLDAGAMGVAATNGYFGRLIRGTVSAGILQLG
jgi:hypothetical protein